MNVRPPDPEFEVLTAWPLTPPQSLKVVIAQMFSGYLTCHLYFYNNFPLADWLKGGIYESIDYRNDVMTAV